jgi:methylated-DNA-[protein]-cysteine S-methyltransferase
VIGVQLPEPEMARARAQLRRRFPGIREAPPPPAIRQASDGIAALLRGEPSELSMVRLDMRRVPSFARRVYEVARTIGPGETLAYGQIAARLGDRSLAREVGQALARNPFPIIVPCHRVLAADGKLGGFSARGGVATKQRLLDIERANVAWQLALVPADTGRQAAPR